MGIWSWLSRFARGHGLWNVAFAYMDERKRWPTKRPGKQHKRPYLVCRFLFPEQRRNLWFYMFLFLADAKQRLRRRSVNLRCWSDLVLMNLFFGGFGNLLLAAFSLFFVVVYCLHVSDLLKVFCNIWTCRRFLKEDVNAGCFLKISPLVPHSLRFLSLSPIWRRLG